MKEIIFKTQLFSWDQEENEIDVKMHAAKWQGKCANGNNKKKMVLALIFLYFECLTLQP